MMEVNPNTNSIPNDTKPSNSLLFLPNNSEMESINNDLKELLMQTGRLTNKSKESVTIDSG